jgi:hypothetical protein
LAGISKNSIIVRPRQLPFIDEPVKGRGMRIIGFDIHRAVVETVAWKGGKLRRLGSVDTRRIFLTAVAATLWGMNLRQVCTWCA